MVVELTLPAPAPSVPVAAAELPVAEPEPEAPPDAEEAPPAPPLPLSEPPLWPGRVVSTYVQTHEMLC